MALKRRCPASGLLHHADQDSPYASAEHQTLLTAPACFSSVKAERRERFDSGADATWELFDSIDVFDYQRRRHSTIGYRSPAAYERQAAVPQIPLPASESSHDLITAQAAEPVANGGIVQASPDGDRRSWGIL